MFFQLWKITHCWFRKQILFSFLFNFQRWQSDRVTKESSINTSFNLPFCAKQMLILYIYIRLWMKSILKEKRLGILKWNEKYDCGKIFFAFFLLFMKTAAADTILYMKVWDQLRCIFYKHLFLGTLFQCESL